MPGTTVLRRWLYLTHRWIGIATCLLFVMWFASGLVMLYVPFPALEQEERVSGLPPIAWEQVVAYPESDGAALRAREVTLEMRGERPVWRISPWEAEPLAIWADSGRPAGRAGEAEARTIAEDFGKTAVEGIRLIHNDQWSVPESYDRHRPLWKAELAGEGGRVLYVSSATGEVVLDTDTRERLWNWFGSIPHWLYPRALREDQPLWRQVVMWVSGPSILGAVTGTWIGLLRIRPGRRRFSGGRVMPYRGWMKWHHVSGLVGAVFLILWIFSGWLSVDPFRLFASEGIGIEARRSYAGELMVPIAGPADLARAAPSVHRVVLRSAAGRPFLSVQQPGASDRLLDPATFSPLAPDPQGVRRAAARLMPEAPVRTVETLTRPDAYWYAVRGEAELPVLRVKFADAAETWAHIDPASGEVLGVGDTRRRVYRWLFDLFHRWDLTLLLATPFARELLIWLMSIAGLISSATAVFVGWRRLRRPRPDNVPRMG